MPSATLIGRYERSGRSERPEDREQKTEAARYLFCVEEFASRRSRSGYDFRGFECEVEAVKNFLFVKMNCSVSSYNVILVS